VDPRQRQRLAEIARNLADRVIEAQQNGWRGEVQGLQVSLKAAQDKLAALDRKPQGAPAARPISEFPPRVHATDPSCVDHLGHRNVHDERKVECQPIYHT
jgi:hypothetical protein